MALQIRKAERRRVPIKMALTGPAGSGKTMSALRLAFGLAGPQARVLLLDTENGSGELYAGQVPDYDVCSISAPFTTQKYLEVIAAAATHGYDVLIIDSLTHAWAGSGGLLEQKEALDKRGGQGDKNRFANWAPITRLHEELKEAILRSPVHVIATMRSKQEHQLNEATRKVEKVGMAPIQRDGMEYEFTLVFDIAQDHTAVASKDRTNLFDQITARLTEEHGRQIAEWLSSGVPATPETARPAQTSSAPATNGRPASQPNARPNANTVDVTDRVRRATEQQPSYADATVQQAPQAELPGDSEAWDVAAERPSTLDQVRKGCQPFLSELGVPAQRAVWLKYFNALMGCPENQPRWERFDEIDEAGWQALWHRLELGARKRRQCWALLRQLGIDPNANDGEDRKVYLGQIIGYPLETTKGLLPEHWIACADQMVDRLREYAEIVEGLADEQEAGA